MLYISGKVQAVILIILTLIVKDVALLASVKEDTMTLQK